MRALLRYYTHKEPENFTLGIPEINSFAMRALLRYHEHKEPEEFTVGIPEVLSFSMRALLRKYVAAVEENKLTVHIPQVLSFQMRSAFRKNKTSEAFTITIPQVEYFDTTCKPYLRTPVLTGSLVYKEGFALRLTWEDESITHTGYALYRDTSPIGEDTVLEPVHVFTRLSREFIDTSIVEGQEYYYRITPLSYTGKYLSNEITLDTPEATGSVYVTFSGSTSPAQYLYLGNYVVPLNLEEPKLGNALDFTVYNEPFANSTAISGYVEPAGDSIHIRDYTGVQL